jgi:hypothetical protein
MTIRKTALIILWSLVQVQHGLPLIPRPLPEFGRIRADFGEHRRTHSILSGAAWLLRRIREASPHAASSTPCLTARESASGVLELATSDVADLSLADALAASRRRALALLCTTSHAQTDDELLTDAKLTLSYFECGQVAQESDVRLSFINRGVKTGRVFLTAIDSNPSARVAAKGKMPFEFYVTGPSVDFRPGQSFDNAAFTAMKDFDVSKHTIDEYKAARALRFNQRNCDLLPN